MQVNVWRSWLGLDGLFFFFLSIYSILLFLKVFPIILFILPIILTGPEEAII